MTVDGATDDHVVTATSEGAVTVAYVVSNTGIAAGQNVTLYVNDAAQPAQTISDGASNTFSVQYNSDGSRAVFARARSAGNIATSNTINSNITGYNSPLCNATLKSLNASTRKRIVGNVGGWFCWFHWVPSPLSGARIQIAFFR